MTSLPALSGTPEMLQVSLDKRIEKMEGRKLLTSTLKHYKNNMYIKLSSAFDY